MKVLIGCEESQEVCKAFRAKGHEAFSCDLQECSGGHPEWHIPHDIFEVIKGGWFVTQAGTLVFIEAWELGVFFPPCTHLAVSGAAWFEQKRKDGRQQEGIDFFLKIALSNIQKTCIENPVGIMSKIYKPPTQIIQPYYFGDKEQKKTCLWLKGLPPLYHNDRVNLFDDNVTHVYNEMMLLPKRERERMHYLPPTPERAKLRSKTFPGIAAAMADQWG